MSEIDFSQYKDHLNELLESFKQSIANYPNVDYNDRASQYSAIRSQYNELRLGINEWNATSATWESNLRARVRDCTDKLKVEVEQLNTTFHAQVAKAARTELLGNAETAELENEMAADEMIANIGETKDLGLNILGELDRHRGKLADISGKVDRLDTGLEHAGGIIHEMQCRDRQRKYFLYGVNAFLLLTLCVFIYYILN